MGRQCYRPTRHYTLRVKIAFIPLLIKLSVCDSRWRSTGFWTCQELSEYLVLISDQAAHVKCQINDSFLEIMNIKFTPWYTIKSYNNSINDTGTLVAEEYFLGKKKKKTSPGECFSEGGYPDTSLLMPRKFSNTVLILAMGQRLFTTHNFNVKCFFIILFKYFIRFGGNFVSRHLS